MCEVKLRLQVQLDRLSLHAFCRLPPGVGVSERGVRHGAGQMGQEGQGGVAFGASGAVAGQVGVGVRIGAEELRSVVSTDGLSQDPPTQSEVSHARIACPALAAGGHTCSEHLHQNTCI